MMPDIAEYDRCMEKAKRRVVQLQRSTEWQLLTEEKTGCIWKLRNNDAKYDVYRYEGIVPKRSPVEVAIMIHPEGVHRSQWDSQSTGTPLIARIREDTTIIRHDTKTRLMGLAVARDAVDLCCFSTDPATGTRSVVMVGVNHPSAPAREGVVRVHTHPSIFIISPSGSDTKVTSITQTEMVLKGFPSAIVDAMLPKATSNGIITFYDDLRSYAATNLQLNFAQSLTGWVQASEPEN